MKERKNGETGAQNQAKYSLSEKYRSIYLRQYFILPGVTILLIMFSWYLIWYQSQILIEATTLTYQQTQLEITQTLAHSIKSYATDQLKSHGRVDIAEVEQEIFKQFIVPVRLLEHGDAWIYTPDHIVFDPSNDVPTEYLGKSMAEIFALQKQKGARHYEEMTEAVMQAREGVGWYIWLPEKGQEIAAWTPVSIGEQVWVIGLSTPLLEILEATGIRVGIWGIYVSMGLTTLAALALLLVWNHGRRQQVKSEAERERVVVVEQEQRLLAETLAQAFLALTSQTDQTKVLDEILKQIQYVVPCDSANIVLIENEVMHLVRWQGYEPADNTDLLSNLEQQLTGFPLDAEVIQSRQPVVVADVQQDPRWMTTPSSAWIRSFMAAPIVLHQQVIGLLRLNSHTPHHFSAQDVARLQPLTHAAAIALENARLYGQLQQELRERTQAEQKAMELNRFLLTVQYIGATIASSLDLNFILDKLAVEIANLLDIERCVLYEWDQRTETISMKAKFIPNSEQRVVNNPVEAGHPIDCALVEWVLSQKRAQQRIVSQLDPASVEWAYMQAANQLKTILLLPMEAQSDVIGLIEIADSRAERVFTIDEVALTQQLANQAAVAIKNARLYDQAKKEIVQRRKVEQELRDSEIKFRTLAETTAAVIFIYQQSRNCYVNPATMALTGYTEAELLAMGFWEIIHPDFRELVKEHGSARLRGEAAPQRYEIKILTKNHEERWLEVKLGLIKFEGEVAAIGTAFDITGRKQMEESLRRSETNLKAILENSRQVFILTDENYRIQAFNRTADYGIQLTLGQKLSEGHFIYEYITLAELDELKRNLEQARQGQPVSQEVKFLVDEAEMWFEFIYDPVFGNDGQVTGVCFSTVDISERKKLIETLAENEKRLLAEIWGVLSVTRALVTETKLSNLLEFIMIQAKHLTQADGAAVLLLNEEGQQFEVAILDENYHWLEVSPLDESRLHIQSNLQLPLKGSLAELALATHTTQIRSPAGDDGRVASIRAILHPKPVEALVCAPLTIQSKDLGVLLIWSERESRFTKQDNRVMTLFADQAALALNNARLHALNQQLAIEQERHRLARELHDSVNQTLYSIGMAAEAALRLLDRKTTTEIREPVLHIHQLAQTVLKEIREQVANLHPAIFTDKTLTELLVAHCTLLREQYGLAVELAADPSLNLSLYQRENLYYIAKEALWNVFKHAPGVQVFVSITQTAHQVTLSIVDNGSGFVVTPKVELEMYGLRSMRERAALLAGSFDLDSRPGQGTRITVQIPLD